ncbi:MAG TPA: CoA pyrophosphatase [Acidimicrobiia bacterium]|nr:CoA pyrophosphatase [Acidimicrobiia bacterium]
MAAKRGGQQRIPRPPSARPGDLAPWAHLDPDERRFNLADVREACRRLPPPHRPVPPPTARPAAVLVPIFDADGEARVILTKRPETMPSHRGEIAFPGGKLETERDGSLRDAALREANEEIGLDPKGVDIVAELDSLTTVASRFVLTPFVGLLSGHPELHRDPSEVVRIFDVPISELLRDDVYREERWDIPADLGISPGRDRAIHFFELAGETVWGATARILAGFLAHLTAGR